MNDNTPAPEARPAFNALVADLRAVSRRQGEADLPPLEAVRRL